MTYVFLSPHFDDAAYSCGGLIWELIRQGVKAEVWTICSGETPDRPLTPFAQVLHARWGTDGAQVIATRKREDAAACERLGAAVRYFGVPDCIYRWLPGEIPLVAREEDLWQPVHPGEKGLVDELVGALALALSHPVTLVCPIGLGNHVDHRLVRLAGERTAQMSADICLAYYADFPYVLRQRSQVTPEPGWEMRQYPLSTEGLAAWEDAVDAYASQLTTFWSSAEEMREQVSGYARDHGGAARLYFLGLTRGPCGVSSIS